MTLRPLAFATSLALLGLAMACFDTVYEIGDPLGGDWVDCCVGGKADTCFCSEPASCPKNTSFPCANDRCSLVSPRCLEFQDGGISVADAGTAGPDGGLADDAGTPVDAGMNGLAPFEFCCTDGRVGTCPCPPSGCLEAPFASCAYGRCVLGAAAKCE